MAMIIIVIAPSPFKSLAFSLMPIFHPFLKLPFLASDPETQTLHSDEKATLRSSYTYSSVRSFGVRRNPFNIPPSVHNRFIRSFLLTIISVFLSLGFS